MYAAKMKCGHVRADALLFRCILFARKGCPLGAPFFLVERLHLLAEKKFFDYFEFFVIRFFLGGAILRFCVHCVCSGLLEIKEFPESLFLIDFSYDIKRVSEKTCK